MAVHGHFSRKATDSLSVEAIAIMQRGFIRKLPSVQIARQIAEATGEQVNPRTIGRRAQEWRAFDSEQKAIMAEKRAEMSALVEAMNSGDLTSTGAIQALAMQALLDDPSAFSKQNPLKIQSQNLRAEEIRIKREALALKEREVQVSEKKLQMLVDREGRAIAALNELQEKAKQHPNRGLTLEDLNGIRDAYGMTPYETMPARELSA